MPVAKPTEVPRFADVLVGATVEPTEAKKNAGFATGEKPPAQILNWLFLRIYSWILWLQDITNQALTWAALATFSKGIAAFNALDSTAIQGTGNGIGAGVFGEGGATNAPGLKGRGYHASGTGAGADLAGAPDGPGLVVAPGSNAVLPAVKATSGGGALAPAIDGENTAAGDGVHAKNSGTGRALFAENSATAPTAKIANAGAGVALEIGAGNGKFSGTAPAVGTTPPADALNAMGQLRCEMILHLNGIGGAPTFATLVDGYNCALHAQPASGTGYQVIIDFLRPFADANYAITYGLTSNSGNLILVDFEKTSASQFKARLWDVVTGVFLNPTTMIQDYVLMVHVAGRQ